MKKMRFGMDKSNLNFSFISKLFVYFQWGMGLLNEWVDECGGGATAMNGVEYECMEINEHFYFYLIGGHSTTRSME